MKSSFVEQLGPRARAQAVDLVTSGSPERITLKPAKGFSATVAVARALARRGVRLSLARHVAERLAAGHAAPVLVPKMDGQALADELRTHGVEFGAPQSVDVGALAALRKRLKLSQEQFANSVGLEVRTLQNWEQGR